MKFDRLNILELIGKDQSRYQHVIITSYSFDFVFFETKILPVLRHANISNINILLDETQLEESIEQAPSEILERIRNYSISPIKSRGVFHPKIMLLIGQKEGLLILGSGNITGSGINSNDEIWAAFHIKNLEINHAPIFGWVWDFLGKYFYQFSKFNRKKIDWIIAQAPWVSEIKSLKSNKWTSLSSSEELTFLSNNEGNSIFDQLKSEISESHIEMLTIVCPYYDKDGFTIEKFNQEFKPKNIECIVELEFGILPIKFNSTSNSNVKFFSWNDSASNADSIQYNRLHAKIFHFKTDSGLEYLLLGSPNSTRQGLGLEKTFYNEEACILIKRNNNRDYLKDLGIKSNSENTIDIQNEKQKKWIQGDSLEVKNYENKITFAEIDNLDLIITFKKGINTSITIGISQNRDSSPFLVNLEFVGNTISIPFLEKIRASIVAIYNGNERISPFLTIQNNSALEKSNPLLGNSKTSALIESFYLNPECGDYADLLKYLDYSWVDEFENTKNRKISSSTIRNEIKVSELNYTKINEDQFNELRSVEMVKQEALLYDDTSAISELISQISKGLILKKDDIESNEQRLSLEFDSNLEGNSDDISISDSTNTGNSKEYEAIHKHFKKVNERFSDKLYKIIETGDLSKNIDDPATRTDILNLGAALSLMIIFHGKTFKEKYVFFGIQHSKELGHEFGKVCDQTKALKVNTPKSFSNGEIFYEIKKDDFDHFLESIKKLSLEKFLVSDSISYTTYEEVYLSNGIVVNGIKLYGLKNHLIDTLGSFLISFAFNKGEKKYSYEPVNIRLNKEREDIFIKASFLIFNIHWHESELKKRNLLLLDLIHLIYPNLISNQMIDELKQEWNMYFSNATIKNSSFHFNMEDFLLNLLPKYQIWKSTYESNLKSTLIQDMSSIRPGTIIFSSRIGFNMFLKLSSDKIIVEKFGFNDENLFGKEIIKFKFASPKLIVFS